MGGLARRATIEERIKKDADGVLIVDAGDNLTGPAVAPPAKLARARFFMEASRKLGVDAMALGEKDREAGLEEKELSTVHGSAIVTRAGIKIGVFSVDLMAPDADKVFAREAANVRRQGAKLSVALMHGAAIKAKELL